MNPQTVDKKQLRNFGFILASGIMILFGVVIPMLKHKPSALWPWSVASLLFLLAFAFPQALKLIYQPWMKLGAILGWINTRIILGFIYFVVMTPISIVLRCIGHDPLSLKMDSTLQTYKIKSEVQDIKHMERPY